MQHSGKPDRASLFIPISQTLNLHITYQLPWSPDLPNINKQDTTDTNARAKPSSAHVKDGGYMASVSNTKGYL